MPKESNQRKTVKPLLMSEAYKTTKLNTRVKSKRNVFEMCFGNDTSPFETRDPKTVTTLLPMTSSPINTTPVRKKSKLWKRPAVSPFVFDDATPPRDATTPTTPDRSDDSETERYNDSIFKTPTRFWDESQEIHRDVVWNLESPNGVFVNKYKHGWKSDIVSEPVISPSMKFVQVWLQPSEYRKMAIEDPPKVVKLKPPEKRRNIAEELRNLIAAIKGNKDKDKTPSPQRPATQSSGFNLPQRLEESENLWGDDDEETDKLISQLSIEQLMVQSKNEQKSPVTNNSDEKEFTIIKRNINKPAPKTPQKQKCLENDFDTPKHKSEVKQTLWLSKNPPTKQLPPASTISIPNQCKTNVTKPKEPSFEDLWGDNDEIITKVFSQE